MPDTPRPDDVPDDLLDLAGQAWDRHAATAPPGTYTHEGIRRAILAAVLPVIERKARERAADELFQRFQRMREEGEHDMRTAQHHVRDVLRGGA